MITDGFGNVSMSRDEYEIWQNGHRRDAAIRIYAAMQANPSMLNTGGRHGAAEAVRMADYLLDALETK